MLSLTAEVLESFHDFEMKMYDQYQHMQKEFNFIVVEGSQSVDRVQAILRRAVRSFLA
jgi:thymidylate kinase